MKRTEKKILNETLREQSQELFGEIIAELREKADLSQDDFAYECGVNRSFISKIEAGQTTVSLITLMKLAIGLNMKASDILIMLEKRIKEQTAKSAKKPKA